MCGQPGAIGLKKKDLEQLTKFVNSLWLLYDARGWYHDTVSLTNDLLNLLASTPSTPERIQQEIMLQTSLARALLATKGYTEERSGHTRAPLNFAKAQVKFPSYSQSCEDSPLFISFAWSMKNRYRWPSAYWR